MSKHECFPLLLAFDALQNGDHPELTLEYINITLVSLYFPIAIDDLYSGHFNPYLAEIIMDQYVLFYL